MKVRDYYVSPKSNLVMRFLWKSAGGDRYLLEQATYSDQVKYMCLGGIIFATGLMAGIAGGYAFYTIFQPKSDVFTDHVDVATGIKSIFFGVIWGLIIFNIDRFIVTSTGKGDGTEAITLAEFKGAIPRIIMGTIIAITISQPLEIRMFKTEINNALHEEQLKLQKDYEISTRKTFEDRLKDLGTENSEIQNRIDDYLRKISIKDSLYNVETSSGQGGRGKGEGPVALALRNERDRLKNEMDAFAEQNKDKIEDITARRKKIMAALDTALNQDKQMSDGLNGLLERIKLSHKVASKNEDGTYGFPWISLFVTLLFLAVELTPVFFKLMLIKTPYDYLAENRDELIKAENGIEVRYDYYKDKVGQERHLVINHEAEKMIYEKIKVTDIQKELTDYAVEKYKEREKKNIDDYLDDYIKKIGNEESENYDEEKARYEQIQRKKIDKELTDYKLTQYKVREVKNIDENMDDYMKRTNDNNIKSENKNTANINENDSPLRDNETLENNESGNPQA